MATGTTNNLLYWDDTYARLGIGTTTPWAHLSVEGQGTYPELLVTGTDMAPDFIIDKNGYLGIGTINPGYLFDTVGSTTDYLARIYNTNSGTSSSGLYIRSDGDSSNLLTLNFGGSDIVNISSAQSTFNNPVTFGSAGDVALAYDLNFNNDSAAYINFQGPGYIRTNSASENLDLNLSAANLGDVVVDDSLKITGTTSIENLGGAGNGNVFTIATGTSGYIFRVTGYGQVYADGGSISGAADYAEYFYTADKNLASGETVCVDVTRENAVKRCERGADGNVMGIVSTHPAIVGNAKNSYEDDSNYKIVGMLGQVPAKVSAENGEIRPGDSLTSASSTPGYAMRANPGDPTVGVALEGLKAGQGEVNVLISRRNKSLTVETVEAQVTKHIAAMEIEDEISIMLTAAIKDYNIASSVEPIVNDQLASFSSELTVAFDNVNNKLVMASSSLDDVIARVNALSDSVSTLGYGLTSLAYNTDKRLGDLEAALLNRSTASSSSGFVVNSDGSIVMGNNIGKVHEGGSTTPGVVEPPDGQTASTSEAGVSVAVVDIEALSNDKTAFVVNQAGDGDVADFRADDVSILNVTDSGKVTIVGQMLLDGRLLVCAGESCGAGIENAVDQTMGDLGVEGKVVAGAFEGYCEDGFTWVAGSAKYGTQPGFCVMSSEARFADATGDGIASLAGIVDYTHPVWTDVSQGQAELYCQSLGVGYHLLGENEWMTMADNVIKVASNFSEEEAASGTPATALHLETGLAATSTNVSATATAFALLGGGNIYNLSGGLAEWTDQTVTPAGLPTIDSSLNTGWEATSTDNGEGGWSEYYQVTDFKGFNIIPPYYYTSANGIGGIRTGTASSSTGYLRGFVRGANGVFSLDLSHSPTEATSTIGFRCAK